MKIIEFHARIQKIKKTNYKIPLTNLHNHENDKIQQGNY